MATNHEALASFRGFSLKQKILPVKYRKIINRISFCNNHECDGDGRLNVTEENSFFLHSLHGKKAAPESDLSNKNNMKLKQGHELLLHLRGALIVFVLNQIRVYIQFPLRYRINHPAVVPWKEFIVACSTAKAYVISSPPFQIEKQ